jgi:HEAT repeat protein
MVNGHPELVAVVLPELEAMLRDPDDHYALAQAIHSLGSAWDPRAADVLLSLVDVDHPEVEVRLALAQALPGGSGNEPARSAAIAILVRLTADDEDDVRDWACFGLGQLNAPRALDAVLVRLNTPEPDDIGLLEIAAAAAVADPTLLPALKRLELAWAGEEDDHNARLVFTIRRCQPEQRKRALAAEGQLERDVNQQLRQSGSTSSVVLTESYPRTTLTLLRSDGTIDDDFGRYRLWADATPDERISELESWVHAVLEHERL